MPIALLVACGTPATDSTPTPVGTPATGSADWKAACTAAESILLGVRLGSQEGFASDAAVLADDGYKAPAADGRRIAAAVDAGDVPGATSTLTQFILDEQSTNLASCVTSTG
jgi:hypothetical protein